jgi:SAM-dependent methyltransferase
MEEALRREIQALMINVSNLDMGEPLPLLDNFFLKVWAGHYARIVSLSQPESGSLTLEIGLGYGIISLVLADRGEYVVSTEHPSRPYLFGGDYRRLLGERGIGLVANNLMEGLPFATGSFHKALYCDVIEHLSPEVVERQIAEIHRVLVPGGVLVLSTPNLSRLWHRWAFFRGRPVNPPLRVRKVGETYDHVREYQWEELSPLFEDAGLRVDRVEYGWIPHFNGDNPGGIINRLTRLMMKVVPSLGDEFYVRMERV